MPFTTGDLCFHKRQPAMPALPVRHLIDFMTDMLTGIELILSIWATVVTMSFSHLFLKES